MTNIALLALEASDATVVITSVSLVFGMLVALCLIITLEGKIFDAMNAKKNPPKAPKAAPQPTHQEQGSMADAFLNNKAFQELVRATVLEVLRSPEGQEILSRTVRKELDRQR